MPTAEQDNVQNFDLTNTGTVVEIDATDAVDVGFQFDADNPVDVEIRIANGDVGPFTVEEFASAARISDGRQAPEATAVRMVTTSTATGTARAALGVAQ
jgi:hypothetical protein